MDKNINETKRLSNLLDNIRFREIYEKILLGNEIKHKEEELILTIMLVLFGNYFVDKRLKKTYNFAYHILLLYSIRTNNYRPLFDISLQLGLYPISRHILIKQLIEEKDFNIHDIISGLFIRESYVNDKIFTLTKNQFEANNYLIESQSKSLAYIAPTSFGKSSIIKDIIKTGLYKRICILAPSKSLIQQNLKNFIEFGSDYSILYHDKMYENQDQFICILTQERAIRILNKLNNFDIIFIDEAHNILDFDKSNNHRGILLSKFLGIANERNKNTKFIYLSPLISNTDNLRTIGLDKIDEFVIKNNIKSELVYYYRNQSVSLYDRFTDKYLGDKHTANSFEQYIINCSNNKNFIYNFKPKNIEAIANLIAAKLEKKKENSLKEIKDILVKEVHPEFNIVNLIEFGIIYLHAKIPTIIKEFLEDKFAKTDSVKFLVANSVILEGVNLPIDTLFITSTTELDHKKLINLIGRVNRLDQVFAQNNLDKLLCDIHFVENKDFNKGHTLSAGIERLKVVFGKDLIKNPLIENYKIDDLKIQKTEQKTKEQRITERQILDKNLKTDFLLLIENNIKTDIYTYLLKNNFEEIYPSEKLKEISEILHLNFSKKVKSNHIVDYIFDFIISSTYSYINSEIIRRLNHEPTRNYYKYYLDTIRILPYKDAINLTYNFFIKKAKTEDPLLYVGTTYGEVIRENKNNPQYNSYKKVYIDLSDPRHTYKNLINLAIVKLKIEEDFISYELNKLVNLLYDFKVINDDEYNLFTYGTNDDKYLKYLYLGINISTIKKLIDDDQIKNIKFTKTSLLIPNQNFKEYLEKQSVLFKFEINKYIQL